MNRTVQDLFGWRGRARVVISARRESALGQAVNLLREARNDADAILADCAKEGEVRASPRKRCAAHWSPVQRRGVND